jgi:hypothetical protein
MSTLMILALALMAQDASSPHVRSTEPKFLALIDAGISGSATFRRLIVTLNDSDVIVYVEPIRTRRPLRGYLSHNIIARGQYRYLRIAVEIAGSERRLVPLLAHELQHAVEVAHAREVRDPESLERFFKRLAIGFGCGLSTCFETRAAMSVEYIVEEELSARSPNPSTGRPSAGR